MSGVETRWVSPLGAGRHCDLPSVRPRSAPNTKTTYTQKRQETAAPYPVQTHVYTVARWRNRTSCFIHSFVHSFVHSLIHSLIHSSAASLKHARHAHAQCDTKLNTHVAQPSLLKTCSSTRCAPPPPPFRLKPPFLKWLWTLCSPSSSVRSALVSCTCFWLP